MVKKKSVFYKNLWRSIGKTKSRFLSIFLIVFLGAAFFAGLRNTPGTMMNSVDAYLDENTFSDLTYISSLGFSEEDINKIKDIEGIDKLEYAYQFDAQMIRNGKLEGINVYTAKKFDNQMINHPDLVKGKYPTKDDECVIDEQLSKDGTRVGDKIEISNLQGEKTFTVVGIINDARYISKTERGTNTLGDGTNAGYIEILTQGNAHLAMPKDLNDLREEDVLYNVVTVSVKGAKEFNIFSDQYDDHIEHVNSKIKSLLSLRMSDLYDKLTNDASSKIDDAQKEYNDGLKTYNDSKIIFDEKILEGKIQLTNAKIALASKEEEFLKGQGTLNEESQTVVSAIKQSSEQLKKDLAEYQKQLEEFQKNPTQTPPSIETLVKDINAITSMLDNTSAALSGLSQLNQADMQLQKAKLQIQQQENKLTLEELKTNNILNESKAKLDNAHQQIQNAKQKINDIPKGKLYTLTWHENTGVASYEANKNSIASIAAIFPLMFFLVSALVSLTTMTRMVEEQRGQSGTLRALGYSKWDIIKQYIIYVILATFFACILGMVIGNQFFPRIIYYLYNLMLFQIDAPILIYSSLTVSLLTIIISVFVTLIATLFVCSEELNHLPATLMRPKAPKLGKRILLEKITFIWKKLSFHYKVTMRNIFRYKKRFLMSIIGIAGCTALIITGFGIKSSVSQVSDLQYEKILKYDATVRLEDKVSLTDAKKYQSQLLKRDEVSNVEYVLEQSINLLKNKEDLYGSLVVYQSMDNIKNFIEFNDFYNQNKIKLDDDGIVLTAKTAELLDVDVNDTIDVELSGQKYNVKVSSIMENYFMNYIYMSQNLYESLTGNDLRVNNAFMTLKNMNESSQKSIETYMKEKDFGSVSYSNIAGDEFKDQVKSIDIVIVILIICAGALNFIVLYNLTNINIQERKSEIATIKVLGFRRREVYDYIFRENILLSIIGSICGTMFGYILHQFIIRTVELEVTMFVRSINLSSYILAVLITLAFTYFINFTMRRVLNKVDMVESLKSIE